MEIEKTNIEGLVIFHPKIFNDERGYFFESYNKKSLMKFLPKVNFVQDNESKSSYGVLRGLHFQKPPFEQSKLVRVIKGKVLDVALDLRKKSKTFGSYQSVILSEENKKQFFIPKGFAHGFLVLSNYAIFSYKVDNYYNKESESGIRYNDKELNIDWKICESEIIVSEKDKQLYSLKKYLLENE